VDEVVIGGVISATILTLVVLPVLYSLVHVRKETPRADAVPSPA